MKDEGPKSYESKVMANVWGFCRQTDKRTHRRSLERKLWSQIDLYSMQPPQVDFLIPLIPDSNSIPHRWTECNPIWTKCTLTLTSQCRPRKVGQTDKQKGQKLYVPDLSMRRHEKGKERHVKVLTVFSYLIT